MAMRYVTDNERRAILAERERAGRCLADLMARERVDLVDGSTGTGRPRHGGGRRWSEILRTLRSLATPSVHRPRSLTEERA